MLDQGVTMIMVSDGAKLALARRREARGLDDGKVMRLREEEGGRLGLVVDHTKPTDNIVMHADTPVLTVAKDQAAGI